MGRKLDLDAGLEQWEKDNIKYILEKNIENIENSKPGDFFEKVYPAGEKTETMKFYIEALQRAGLDIGKGEGPTYGWRMPEPGKNDTQRVLIIFRRK